MFPTLAQSASPPISAETPPSPLFLTHTAGFACIGLTFPSAAYIPLWYAGLPIQSSTARVLCSSFGAALYPSDL